MGALRSWAGPQRLWQLPFEPQLPWPLALAGFVVWSPLVFPGAGKTVWAMQAVMRCEAPAIAKPLPASRPVEIMIAVLFLSDAVKQGRVASPCNINCLCPLSWQELRTCSAALLRPSG